MDTREIARIIASNATRIDLPSAHMATIGALILSRIDYCNAVFQGTPSGTIIEAAMGAEQCS